MAKETVEQRYRKIEEQMTVPVLPVPVPLLQAVLNYLQQRPYMEVAQLIQQIMSISPPEGEVTNGAEPENNMPDPEN